MDGQDDAYNKSSARTNKTHAKQRNGRHVSKPNESKPSVKDKTTQMNIKHWEQRKGTRIQFAKSNNNDNITLPHHS